VKARKEEPAEVTFEKESLATLLGRSVTL